MSYFRFVRTLLAPQLIACVLFLNSLWAAEPDGAALYRARCASCHDSGSAESRTPKREEIATRSPESILNTMFEGAMVVPAAGLTLDEGRALARFITGKEFSSFSNSNVPMTRCEAPAKKISLAPSDWNGWSAEPDNSRYQAKPGLSASDIPRLKLKWAFAFPGENRAYAQPTIAGGRVFVGTAGGMVYSLDAATGCVYWAFKADGSVRAAISIARSKSGGRYIAYFGDLRARAYAVDAENGALIWKLKVDEHPVARITGSPVFYDGRLFVPIASLEEGSARSGQYECCTFRGSLVALDAETGRQLWKSFTVLDPPKATKKNRNGMQMYGPAGAAIWSAPTIDAKRKLIYTATGDSYTGIDINTSDAILAFNIENGRLVWVSQVTERDNYIVGCPASPNCPEQVGPDYDFGSSPMLRPIAGGKQIIVAGQKSGVVWGLDPDQKGKVVWQTKLGAGSVMGGVQWGPGADGENTYVAISDVAARENAQPARENAQPARENAQPARENAQPARENAQPARENAQPARENAQPARENAQPARENAQPGISALKLATGEKVWNTPAPKVTCARPTGCQPAQSAAVSVIPGAVFSGAVNGIFRAYSTKTGEILWDFDTAQSFNTVNKVPGKGGAINGGGPAIANGMVFTNSGYGAFGQSEGNVLLAFSVDGK